jgi:magnesium transporter
MLSIYVPHPQGLQAEPVPADGTIPDAALWLDLLEPTHEEERRVEKAIGVNVPTREEMREIEASNRFHEEDGALYMTATLVTKLDADLPQSTQVTFILAGGRLVTNRYVDPLPFRRFIAYAERHPLVCTSGAMLLAGLLESIINRIADVIERVDSDLDTLSAEVFAAGGRRSARDFRQILARIGQGGELTSKARESLVSLARLLAFVQQSANGQVTAEARSRLRTLARDVLAMSDHASFLGNKVTFILEATLGMINIDQNNILKIFSVVAVFLLPPSVVAGFYGMNFEFIPWLAEPRGHWIALALMLLSAVLPYAIFKARGWL